MKLAHFYGKTLAGAEKEQKYSIFATSSKGKYPFYIQRYCIDGLCTSSFCTFQHMKYLHHSVKPDMVISPRGERIFLIVNQIRSSSYNGHYCWRN